MSYELKEYLKHRDTMRAYLNYPRSVLHNGREIELVLLQEQSDYPDVDNNGQDGYGIYCRNYRVDAPNSQVIDNKLKFNFGNNTFILPNFTETKSFIIQKPFYYYGTGYALISCDNPNVAYWKYDSTDSEFYAYNWSHQKITSGYKEYWFFLSNGGGGTIPNNWPLRNSSPDNKMSLTNPGGACPIIYSTEPFYIDNTIFTPGRYMIENVMKPFRINYWTEQAYNLGGVGNTDGLEYHEI